MQRLGYLAALAAGLCGSACGLDLSILNLPPAVVAVRLAPVDTTVMIGARFQLGVALEDEHGAPLTGRLVGWSTDAPGVVRVDTTGTVYALASGTAVVTARSEGHTGDATINVVYEPVASLQILPQTALLAAGQTRQFRADVRDGGGFPSPTPAVVWRTTDSAVATVDTTGLLRSHAPGNVAVVAEAAGKSDTAPVTVVVPLASITVSPGDTVAAFGARVTYSAVMRDLAGNVVNDRPVAWSGGGAIAAVAPSGDAVAMRPGTTTITATATGTTGTATLQVRPLVLSSVASGAYHTCGLAPDGVAYCWGEADHGELGAGSGEARVGHAVMVATTLRFVSIVAGGGHTCALTVAGAAYCWGSNAWGQLGAPTGSACGEPCSLTPVAVEGGFTFASLTAGANHTCGVTPTGAAYCWGNNSNGKLGRTTSFTTPGPVMGNIVFASLAAGAQHTCGLATDGTIYCWGDGQGGALGDGIGGGHVQPLPVLGGLTFTAVSAGWGTSCGVAADSTVYCWGLRYGATGNYFLDRPTQVASRHFASISVGTDHYCGVGADAVGYCWGANRFGQNGVGHSTPLDTPTAVDAVFTFVQLSGGGQHSCGIAADGFAYCWGSNAWGQLGRIGGDVFSSPVLIEGQQ